MSIRIIVDYVRDIHLDDLCSAVVGLPLCFGLLA